MSTEPFQSDVPTQPRDRREHGGAPMHPNDDELARRTERERVEAGVRPYDSDDVPPAADAALPLDDAETDTGVEDVGARQGAVNGYNPFPPTRYSEQ
jgi:hypothetical protein